MACGRLLDLVQPEVEAQITPKGGATIFKVGVRERKNFF